MNSHNNIGSPTTRQSGYSLIEILIAIVVTSVGLLGLAGMQATGLNNNQRAYHRSQATVLAYDLADRMRANNAGSIGNYLTSFMTLAEATAVGVQVGCNSTAGCSAAQMAQNDLRDWNAALVDALPSPAGTIILDGDIYTISVTWDDNRDGAVNDDDPNFQMSFQP